MSAEPVTIRMAEPRDIPLLLQLLRQKAAFDGVPDALDASEQMLQQHLFAAPPSAYVAFAQLGGRVVGFASYYFTFSTFLGRPGIWLDDLFVEADARSRGVGAALLTHLAELAVQRGMGRIEWLTATDNERGLAFYARSGARVHDGVRLLRLEPADVARLARGEPIDRRSSVRQPSS